MIPFEKRLPTYTLFLTLGALITFIVLMASPSDPQNAVIFGYSLERIVLGLGVLIPGAALLTWTLNLFRQPEYSIYTWMIFTKRGIVGDAFLLFSFAVLLSSWIIKFLPPYRLGMLAGYIERLSPIINWLAVIGGVTIILFFIERKDETVRSLKNDCVILKIGFIQFTFFFVLGVISLITGIGIYYPADYWYGAGVPVLGLQVLLSLLLGTAVLLSEHWLEKFDSMRLDLFAFFVFWIVSAWLWSRLPISPNYFMPDTANNILFPYSDGATFDQGAQYALIGQGLFNGQYFDRTVYSALLVYLHRFFGQDFETLVTAQAVLFAVFPAVVYLLGRELHSRALGISAGVLLALRGVNAIVAAKWIDTASPKMMLTDFPTAIGISIFLLLLTKWVKKPSKMTFLLWSGAAFGLTLMVRTHMLALLPMVLVFIPIVMKLRWKQIVLMVLLMVMGLLTVTLPWEIRNQARSIPMFYMYYYRIEIILFHRYGIGEGANIPSILSEGASDHIVETPVRGLLRQRNLEQASEPFCETTLCSIINHFVHNTATSIVTLPSSLMFHDVWNIVKSDVPYWRQDWREGFVGIEGGILIVVNLALISLGVGTFWKRSIILTLLPILIFLTYLLTNSLGFTSGGRYIAPVDWIVYLYFMAGGLQLIIWLLKMAGFNVEGESNYLEKKEFFLVKGNKYISILPTMAAILAVGVLLPLSEMFLKPRYQVREASEILTKLENSGLLEESGYSRDEINRFLSHPDAMMREGRALYPRYYPPGEGEPDRSTYYRYLDYQRLVFTLISPYSPTAEGVVLPGDLPAADFHAADVVVIGCWNTTYYAPFIDPAVVFHTSGEGFVYMRDPSAPLQCPFVEP